MPKKFASGVLVHLEAQCIEAYANIRDGHRDQNEFSHSLLGEAGCVWRKIKKEDVYAAMVLSAGSASTEWLKLAGAL